MKFSACNSNQLGVLTPRDLQLFELVTTSQAKTESQMVPEKQKTKALSSDYGHKMTRSFVRKTYIDVSEIETFEWPPFSSQPQKLCKDQRFQGILAGTSTGEILLISLEQKLSSFGGAQLPGKTQRDKNSFIPYRIEKKLVDKNIKVQRRRCNALAWNSVAHNLVAAGYERSNKTD